MADERQPLLSRRSTIKNHVESTPVYPIIHLIRADVMRFIDTPLTYEALTAPDLTYTLIRPLVEKYTAMQHSGNMSIVFCLLVNRVYFLRDQSMGTAPVSRSRAELCEILAIQCLRDYGNEILQLTLAITTTWPVYAGADPELVERAREEMDDDLEDRIGNSIEMAILGRAKRFIKSSSCQNVIDNIWSGRCVYQAESSHSFLADPLFWTTIGTKLHLALLNLELYAKQLQRLKVPAIRSVLEYLNFLILFVLFLIAIETNEQSRINPAEALFMIYAMGFCLEKLAAMQEHGIQVYFKGTWNGFDLAFVTTYLIYASLRVYGVYWHHNWARKAGIDSLAIIACLMFPRLAFVTLRNNLMVLSLRAMMMQFLVLMLISTFCFLGFFYALWILGRAKGFSAGTVGWWMLDLYFGLDATGFAMATTFHEILGPVLLVTYACLSNTLLLTVLVSILSHTFSTINEDAEAEAMFRKAVSTIEGVKSDALFSYQPPINLVALLIMFPASYLLSPRWFHKVNVFMIRLTSFPILLIIAWYERQVKKSGSTSFFEAITDSLDAMFDLLPKNMKRLTFFDGLAGYDAGIDAVFELEEEFNNTAIDTDFEDLAPGSAIEPPLTRVPSGSKSPRSQKSPLPKVAELEEEDSPQPPSGNTPPSSGDDAAQPPQVPKRPPVSHSPPHSSTSPPLRFNARARAKSMMHPPTNTQLHTDFTPAISLSPPTHSHSPPKDNYGGVSPHHHRRVTSLLNRGQEAVQSFTSPLAQIFQPLVVDDFPEEDTNLQSVSSPGAALTPVIEGSPLDIPTTGTAASTGVSYGPASRRLSTIQRSPPITEPSAVPAGLGWPKIRRPSEGSSSSVGLEATHTGQMLSRSPESIGAEEMDRHINLTPPIETEELEAVEEDQSQSEILAKVAAMQRQMEELQRQTQDIQGQTRDLLEQLAKGLIKK